MDLWKATWKKGIYDSAGRLNKKAWEIGLFYSVKKGLRSGNLYLPQSRYYRDFWAPMYNEKDWRRDRKSYYKELHVPEKGEKIIEKLNQEFSEQLYMAVKNIWEG